MWLRKNTETQKSGQVTRSGPKVRDESTSGAKMVSRKPQQIQGCRERDEQLQLNMFQTLIVFRSGQRYFCLLDVISDFQKYVG